MNVRRPTIPPPTRAGDAVRGVRRRWRRRALGAASVIAGALLLLVIGVPALAFCWGAIEARYDIERGRPELRGFGRPDFSSPRIDKATGLPWRSLGCSVDPVSSLGARAYNLVTRRAVERDEITTKRERFCDFVALETAHARGALDVPESGELELGGAVIVEVADVLTLRVGERRRSVSSLVVPPRSPGLTVQLVDDLVVFRSRWTHAPAGGGEDTWETIRVWCFDADDAEYLQRHDRVRAVAE